MNQKFLPIWLVLTLGMCILGFVSWKNSQEKLPTELESDTKQDQTASSNNLTVERSLETIEIPKTKTIIADNIPNINSNFKFSVTVPKDWQVEAIKEIDAINFYSLEQKGGTNLEKSQIFIRQFRANTFLTLSTVNIHSRTSLNLNGRPAIRYDIEKKSGIANFANQPSWRNRRHIVTDIRVTDSNPSIFYVIAKRPDLKDEVYQDFLESFRVIAP